MSGTPSKNAFATVLTGDKSGGCVIAKQRTDPTDISSHLGL